MVARRLIWYQSSWICTETKGNTYRQDESRIERGGLRKQIDVLLQLDT
jgi:hypothetical protein